MKSVGIKEYLVFMAENVSKDFFHREFPESYLKDNEGKLHRVNEIDLLSDRLRCDDGFWYCYDWMVEDANEGKERLFIEM